jgi:hypothetical protein
MSETCRKAKFQLLAFQLRRIFLYSPPHERSKRLQMEFLAPYALQTVGNLINTGEWTIQRVYLQIQSQYKKNIFSKIGTVNFWLQLGLITNGAFAIIHNEHKAACTHTGLLPESDPALVVQFFTCTGITAAGGQHRSLYVASLILNAAQVRRARRANFNAVTSKLICRPSVRHPACRVQVRHANLLDRQLGGACADRLRMNTPIYLHCIQRRSRTQLQFYRCVCKRPKAVYMTYMNTSTHDNTKKTNHKQTYIHIVKL